MLYQLCRVCLVCVCSLFIALYSSGCPCGCGSSVPLTGLYEGQTKLRLGLSHRYLRRYIPRIGAEYMSFSEIAHVSLVDLAVAYGIYPNISLSATFVGERNQGDLEHHYAMGDPSFHLNYSFNQHHSLGNFPEIYLSFGTKIPVARSFFDSFKSALEVHSNGFWELSPSLSLLMHFGGWGVGITDVVIWKVPGPKARSVLKSFRPGLINRSEVLGSYSWYGYSSVQLSLQHEHRFSDSNQSGILKNSSSQLFLAKSTFNMKVGYEKTVSLHYERPVFLSQSYNIDADEMISVSYSQSL